MHAALRVSHGDVDTTPGLVVRTSADTTWLALDVFFVAITLHL